MCRNFVAVVDCVVAAEGRITVAFVDIVVAVVGRIFVADVDSVVAAAGRIFAAGRKKRKHTKPKPVTSRVNFVFEENDNI